MAVNLVRNYDQDEAEHLVNSSFAQFQSDRTSFAWRRRGSRRGLPRVVPRADAVRPRRHRGVPGVADSSPEDRRADVQDGTRAKRVNRESSRSAPGDVIKINAGRRRGRYAVIEVVQRKSERKPRVLAVSGKGALIGSDRRICRTTPPTRGLIGRGTPDAEPILRKGRSCPNGSKGSTRRPVRRQRKGPAIPTRSGSRAAVDSHPVARCPHLNRHIHYAERAERLEQGDP